MNLEKVNKTFYTQEKCMLHDSTHIQEDMTRRWSGERKNLAQQNTVKPEHIRDGIYIYIYVEVTITILLFTEFLDIPFSTY